jgi:adenylosuccinate synthase
MLKTDFCFEPGKLSVLLDSGYGSSGKGKLGSFITEHASNWQFCLNTFFPQAGHWVRLDDGRQFFYQTLNSCAYNYNKFDKMYIGHGAAIELRAFWREIRENQIPHKKIGISPIASILQDIDADYERGTRDLEGNPIEYKGIAIKSGTTAHGCGACRARKILRKQNVLLARDVPELKEFLCDVPTEIMKRLDKGESGFMEVAQGFSLSIGLQEFYPSCTMRNATVAAGLDDMMLPPYYAGPVVLNVRSFPIRINSKKYVELRTARHLTWEEVQSGSYEYVIEDSHSGGGYPDQKEITWEELTATSGYPTPLMEMTSVTKLPRRVFTFSKIGLEQSIRHNYTGHPMYISLNFANYIDHNVYGLRGLWVDHNPVLCDNVAPWINNNIGPVLEHLPKNVQLAFIGTGPHTDDTIMMDHFTR